MSSNPNNSATLYRCETSQGRRRQPENQLPATSATTAHVRGRQVSAQQHHRPARVGRDRDDPVPAVGPQQGHEIDRKESEVLAAAQPEAGGHQVVEEVQLGQLPERPYSNVTAWPRLTRS